MYEKSLPNLHRRLQQRNNDLRNRQIEDGLDPDRNQERKEKDENRLPLVTELVPDLGQDHVIVVIGGLDHEIVEDLDHVIARAGGHVPDRGIGIGGVLDLGIEKRTAMEALLLIL